VDGESATYANYRDMMALKLTENRDHLEKLMWDMQDVMDNLASESQKQVDCLGEIEGLIGTVHPAKSAPKESLQPSQPPISHCEEGKFGPLSVRPVMEDKAVQCGELVDEAFNLAALEDRHCQYMLEVLSHLRFVLEIISPFEIERPALSKPIDQSEDYSRTQAETEGDDKGTECETGGSGYTAEGESGTYVGVEGQDAESACV